MKYRIKRVRYDDGTKSPWWKIVIYKYGKPYDESIAQYSSFLDVFRLWLKATILC